MLINIDPILSPKLLSALRSMGHGDTLVLADAKLMQIFLHHHWQKD